MPSARYYVALARQAITELLADHLAAPTMEIEARIADSGWPSLPTTIDVIHVRSATRQLLAEGEYLSSGAQPTRGSHPVHLLTAQPGRNATAIDKAASRKRLLTARYLGWAQGTPTHKALIGPAAERVVHASLTRAAPRAGYRVENPTGGTADRFLGITVPIGPLDNAALLQIVTDGIPDSTIAVPVEVKNPRDWLYPGDSEVYQLLTKAARLQVARPSIPMVPVLVARRIHLLTFRLFRDIGAFGIQTRRQYISASVEDDRLQEVRSNSGSST